MEEENAKERSNREINNKDKSIFIINSSITNHAYGVIITTT